MKTTHFHDRPVGMSP